MPFHLEVRVRKQRRESTRSLELNVKQKLVRKIRRARKRIIPDKEDLHARVPCEGLWSPALFIKIRVHKEMLRWPEVM